MSAHLKARAAPPPCDEQFYQGQFRRTVIDSARSAAERRAMPSVAAPEKERAVDPILLLGSFLKHGTDTVENYCERVLSDTDQ